jgi:hypothetical protein
MAYEEETSVFCGLVVVIMIILLFNVFGGDQHMSPTIVVVDFIPPGKAKGTDTSSNSGVASMNDLETKHAAPVASQTAAISSFKGARWNSMVDKDHVKPELAVNPQNHMQLLQKAYAQGVVLPNMWLTQRS